MSAERLGREGLWKRLLGDEAVGSLVEVQRTERYTERLSYSQSGRRTNSRSNMNLCGIESRSFLKISVPYSSISRSILRGPFSMVLFLPNDFSMSCNSFKSSSGSSVVSTYGLAAVRL